MKTRALAVVAVLLFSLAACAADSESQPVARQPSQRESFAPAPKASTSTAAPIAEDPKAENPPQPDRVTAASNCFATSKLSACLTEADDGAVKKCLGQCIKAIDARDRGAAKQAEADCEDKVIASQGKRVPSCGIASVATTEDETKLKAEYVAALKTRNPDQVDAVMARVLALDKRNDEIQCAKTCNERGRNRARAPLEGPALVTSYKQCMVSADSTMEARKLAAYEDTLYCAYIIKADTRCREASKCDWIEKFSDLVCTYDTPGRSLAECQQ